MAKKTKVITQRQWQNLNKKLDGVQAQLVFLEQNLPRKSKRWLKFEEAIPPASVCREVNSMLDGINNYIGFLGRLSEYYGCPKMELYVDTTIEPKYQAIYYADRKTARTRTKTVDVLTVLHEFFHHLVAENVVVCDKKQEEKYAGEFASIFIQRIKGAGR